VIGPAVGADRDVMGASMIPAIDQYGSNAACLEGLDERATTFAELEPLIGSP